MPKRFGVNRLPHGKKPDFDNLAKSVVDSLNGIAWRDDSLLCDVRVQKWIAAENEQPHVVVTMKEVP